MVCMHWFQNLKLKEESFEFRMKREEVRGRVDGWVHVVT